MIIGYHAAVDPVALGRSVAALVGVHLTDTSDQDAVGRSAGARRGGRGLLVRRRRRELPAQGAGARRPRPREHALPAALHPRRGPHPDHRRAVDQVGGPGRRRGTARLVAQPRCALLRSAFRTTASARSSSVSSSGRTSPRTAASRSIRARRPASSSRLPAAVADTRLCRRSAATSSRRTSPAASKRPDGAGDRRPGDLLGPGQRRHRGRPAEDEDREQGEPLRGETGHGVRCPGCPEGVDRGAVQGVRDPVAAVAGDSGRQRRQVRAHARQLTA